MFSSFTQPFNYPKKLIKLNYDDIFVQYRTVEMKSEDAILYLD